MRISGLIQAGSVLSDPLLAATNESYFCKLNGRIEARILTNKVILPRNIRGTPRKSKHDTHFSGVTKALSSLFGPSKHFVANSRTGESDIENETKYASIQDMFVGKTLKCKKLNERLWIYDMVYWLKIPILRYHNTINSKFRWRGRVLCFNSSTTWTPSCSSTCYYGKRTLIKMTRTIQRIASG